MTETTHPDSTLTRREFIQHAAVIGAAAVVLPGLLGDQLAQAQTVDPYALPPLPYAYDALEPHIDKLTMEIWTNGVVRPDEAASLSARILSEHLMLFINLADNVNDVEIMVEKGRGYLPAEKRKLEPVIGVIPVDSLFSPVNAAARGVLRIAFRP